MLIADTCFVDDEVVFSLATGARERRGEQAPGLLTADELDFAGWGCVSGPRSSPEPAAQPRRAAAPVLVEAGLGEPHFGRHRWWLAGVAGAVASLLASALLLALADRPGAGGPELSIIRPAPADREATFSDDSARAEPELTRLSDED